MSPARARFRDHAVNAVITAIATLFLTFGTGLWHSKEDVSAHKADVQLINGKLERILDLLCERDPDARQCAAPPSTAAGDVVIR